MVFIDSGTSHSNSVTFTMGIWVFVTFHVSKGGGGVGGEILGGGGSRIQPLPI